MKIQSIIESCNECQFAKEYAHKSSNSDFVLICAAERIIKGETVEYPPFLIDHGGSPILQSYTIKIPKNCPLEDYTPKVS